MKTLEQIYRKWSHPDGHGDKGTAHTYIPEYSRLFEPYRDKKINILEIGVAYILIALPLNNDVLNELMLTNPCA